MQGKKVILLLITALILIVVAIFVGAAILYLMHPPVTVQQGSVLELTLGSSLSEFPAEDPLVEMFSAGSQNLWELRQTLKSAAADNKIAALLLEVYPQTASWAQIEEVREILSGFQKSGKKIYTFLGSDISSEKEIYLASGTDYITMNPTSGLLIDGLMAEVVFMKRAMDKLGIRPQFIQLKEYKSPETYTRERMTPEIRAMIESILAEQQERFISTVTEERNLESEKLRELVDIGLLTAAQAVESKIVDELTYSQQLRNTIQAELSPGQTYHSISSTDYFDSVPGPFSSGGSTVGLVSAVGTIVPGRSEPLSGLLGGSSLADQLKKLREDRNIKGVILRVDSPGGSPLGSDLVWREVTLLKEAGKPVVVSMSGVAASGGYYISMGASKIVSQPSTITGSIGVIFGKFDLSGFYEWIGMDVDRIKTAPNADLMSFQTPLTENQREQVENWMYGVYNTFVLKASEGRDMEYEELESKAHGRIYTGAQALDEGLVDRLGGLSAALEEMKTALNLPPDEELRLELYPKPKTLWETLRSGDLFKLRAASSALGQIQEQLTRLETPSIWLLAPEIRMH